MGFSGEARYINWWEDYHQQYDDAYFGEWVECIICWSMYESDSEQWSDDTERICEDCYSRLNNHKLHCDVCWSAHIITKEEVKNWDYYVCNMCRETNPNLPKNTYTDLQIADHRC
jgi:hypothetical protein